MRSDPTLIKFSAHSKGFFICNFGTFFLIALLMYYWRTGLVALLTLILNSSKCLVFIDRDRGRKDKSLMRKFLILDLWDRMLSYSHRCFVIFSHKTWASSLGKKKKNLFKASAHLLQWPRTSLFVTCSIKTQRFSEGECHYGGMPSWRSCSKYYRYTRWKTLKGNTKPQNSLEDWSFVEPRE